MHPALSSQARVLLRALPIDPRIRVEQRECYRELVDKGLLQDAPRVGVVFTTAGARQLLALLVEEELAVVCRCGLPRSAHTGPSPHDAPENGCRAFTPATPVYTKPERRHG